MLTSLKLILLCFSCFAKVWSTEVLGCIQNLHERKSLTEENFNYSNSNEDATIFGISPDPNYDLQKDEEVPTNPQNDCFIDINKNLGNPQPLLIKLGTNKFILPQDSNGIIVLPHHSQIELGCPTKIPTDSHVTIATCQSEDKFSVNGNLYAFKDLKCGSNPWHSARRTGVTCFNESTVIEVGFDFGNRFLQLMDICHNEQTEATYYSHYYLTPLNVFHQKSVQRPGFTAGSFFSTHRKQADRFYSKSGQISSFTPLLGAESVQKYFTKTMFLTRGHLAAKSDFIFGAHQRASFYLVNVAPQWQTFNGANWQVVENAVRKFVAHRNINAEIYTGTFGVTTLPDANGDEQELFLNTDSRGVKSIPVPKVFYKIIIDTMTRDGVVFVGVNNPYLSIERIEKDYIFCTDILSEIGWIKLDTNIAKGYTYACDVTEFKERVQHLPDNLNISGLLQ